MNAIPTIPPMDEATRQLVFADGTYNRARVKNTSGTETQITWFGRCLTDDAHKITERLGVIEAVRTLPKTRARAKMTTNYGKARDKIEQRGLKFIEEGYDGPAKRPLALRIFYRSEGGEILCCESEPMSHAGVNAAKDFASGPEWCLWLSTTPAAPNSMHGIERVEIPHELRLKLAGGTEQKQWKTKLKEIPTHARFVVFPSQRLEPVETTEEVC